MGKKKYIPVNKLPEESRFGMAIRSLSANSISEEKAHEKHRHDYHIFMLIEKGTVQIEIDFKLYHSNAPLLLYIHPNQIHRIVKTKANIFMLGINDENLKKKYLEALEEIAPGKPINVKPESMVVLSRALRLCDGVFQDKHAKLRLPILKDSCNTFVGLAISQYFERIAAGEALNRYEKLTKKFKLLLEKNFTSFNRPTYYANILNITTPYLNECVRNTTGFSTTYHIQQRVVLEAKRLLYHSDKNIKEIAFALGFEDPTYFSRYFNKVTGQSPLTFRQGYFD